MVPRQAWPVWVPLWHGWGCAAGVSPARSAFGTSGPMGIFVAQRVAVGHQTGDGQSQALDGSAGSTDGSLLSSICHSGEANRARAQLSAQDAH